MLISHNPEICSYTSYTSTSLSQPSQISPSRFSAQHQFSSHSFPFLDGRIFIPAFNSCRLHGAHPIPRMGLLFLPLSALRNAENQDLKAWQEHTPSEPSKIQIYRINLRFWSPLGRAQESEEFWNGNELCLDIDFVCQSNWDYLVWVFV